jgi:hypothetical protein
MARLRAVWVTQAVVGWAVAPRIRTLGGVLDDGQDVYPRAGQGHRFEEVGGEDGVGLGPQEPRPGLAAPLRRRVNAGISKPRSVDPEF